jgi:hypothetical protein
MRHASASALAIALVATSCARTPKPAQPPPQHSPLVAPRVGQGDLDASVLLNDLPARAVRLGAGPLSLVASGEVFEGERLGAFVDVPSDLCLLGYSRASSSIEDLDVGVFSDEGALLADDEAPDVHPTVLLCPPHPERVYMMAHAVTGEGLVALAAHLVPKDRATVVGRALGARGTTGEGPRPAEAWPGLDDDVRSHRAALGGTWEEFRKIALPVDSRAPTFVAFPLEADGCTDAVIIPGDEVALLDVEVLDSESRVVARAREGGRQRALTVCSPLAVAGSLSIRPHIGRGLAAVVLARARGDVVHELTAQPELLWVAPQVSADEAKGAREALLVKRGYDPARAATGGTLTLGRRVSVPLEVHGIGAPCARVDVLAGKPLALLDASIWDDGGALVSTAEGSASVTLWACGREKARLDLETRGRPGPYTVVVRGEKWKDPSFATSPLAAARMFARAAEGPEAVLEGAPISARAVALDAAHLSSWSETIVPGKCVRVAVGTQGEGVGVELRAFEAGNGAGAELDRSHGANAASVRACAPPEAPRQVRFELRATTGKLDAVVGERGT